MKHLISHDCKEELRNANLKVTPARLGVLSALEKTDKPLDVTELIDFLEVHNVQADRVTVFRIINAFTKKGLAKPIQFNEGKLRYEHSGKADHHHFVCEKCGDIQDISDCTLDTLEKELQKKKGLIINRHSLEFFGLCCRCQQ